MFRHAIVLLSVVFAASATAGEVQPDPVQPAPKTSKPLPLRAGDRLVVLGGTFAERLVASGYFETLLVSRQPKLRLSLRSLAWPADEVTRKEFQFELIRYMNGRKGWADGGRQYTGMILEKTPTHIRLASNPLGKAAHKPIEIPVGSIELTKPLAISLMPEKLVNTLSREEILDLVAYIEARGRSDHRVYGAAAKSPRKSNRPESSR